MTMIRTSLVTGGPCGMGRVSLPGWPPADFDDRAQGSGPVPRGRRPVREARRGAMHRRDQSGQHTRTGRWVNGQVVYANGGFV